MAKFRFTLEPLLRVRQIQEDRAKATFLAALRGFRGKEGDIARLAGLREDAKGRCVQEESGSLDLQETLRARRYINVLFQRISQKQEELQRLRPALEKVQADYRHAVTRRQAVEKIRERRWSDYLREEERKERRVLDEVGQVGFLRARAEAVEDKT